MNDGAWIKLHRRILQWEWFSDSKTLHVFIYLLLMANFKDGNMKGRPIKRGQVVSSYFRIAMATGMSVSSARRAVDNLVSTGEILLEPTNKYTIITIVKYDSYQDKYAIFEQTDEQTNEQHHKKKVRRKKEEKPSPAPEPRKEPKEALENPKKEPPYLPQYWERNIPTKYHGQFRDEDAWWEYVDQNKEEVEKAYEL